MIAINKFDFGAPAPVGPASGIRVTAEDEESIFSRFTNAEHDSCVIMPAIHPTGFILIGDRVIAKSEHTMLWLPFDGALIQIKCKASTQYQLDTSLHRRLIGQYIRLAP